MTYIKECALTNVSQFTKDRYSKQLKAQTMGNVTILILSYFFIYLTYSCLTGCAQATKVSPQDELVKANSHDFARVLGKRATRQFYAGLPNFRREKPISGMDMEFVDDSDFDKRAIMDDYGHLRFGKRGQDWQEDYGHLRFGRR